MTGHEWSDQAQPTNIGKRAAWYQDLEHNDAWARIFENALASFTDRMVLILLTSERAVTEIIARHPEVGVPDIAFRLADLTDRFPPNVTYAVHRIPSATQYGWETIFSRGLGRRVAFIGIPPEAMRDASLGAGLQVWLADGLPEEYALYRHGEAAAVASGVRDAIGKAPRTFEEFGRVFAAMFW